MLLPFKIILHLFFILQFCFPALSQELETKICINKSSVFPLVLQEFRGTKLIEAGLIKSSDNCIQITKGYKGFIRISFQDKFSDIILEGKSQNITVYVNADSVLEVISDSPEQFLMTELKKQYTYYSNSIQNTKDDVQKDKLIQRRNSITDSILAIYPNSFFSRSTKYALLNTKNLNYEKIIDTIPWEEPDLVHCTLIPKLIMAAIASIGSPDEKILFLLIDEIYKQKINSEVKEMTTDFLIDFFTATHADAALNYLTSNYVDSEFCYTNLSNDAQRKLKQIELYKTGNRLPDVIINQKKISKLIKRKKEKIAIIVWSTDCPHCIELLNKMQNSPIPDYFIIGIEISGNETKSEWPALSLLLQEKNGWKSEITEKWLIDRTPTVFIIQSDLKIISVPGNPEEFFYPH